MAISFVGATSANATTTSLPSGSAAGDLALVVAGRTTTEGPSIPAGWDDQGVVAGGTVHGSRTGWKILDADDITAGDVGTWANASQIGVAVYRGVALARRNGIAGVGVSSATVTLPGQSSLASGSWQVAIASHRTSGSNTLKSRTATNYTNRSSALTSNNIGIWDSNAPTSGIAQRTVTVTTASGNVGWTFELTAAEVVNTQEALTLSVAETAQLLAFLQRTDQAALTLTEARTILSRLARSDALPLTLTEQQALLAALSASDALPVALGESPTITVSVSAQDTLTLSLVEAVQLLAFLQRTDQAVITVAEARTLLSLLARAEAVPVALQETASMSVQLLSQDALLLALAEQVDRQDILDLISKSASDALMLGVDEQRALQSLLQRTDQAALTLTEARSILSTLSRADAAPLSLHEQVDAVLGLLHRTDVLVLELQADADVTEIVALVREEGLTIVLTESASVEQMDALQRLLRERFTITPQVRESMRLAPLEDV